jgi:hypothetical protein
MSQKGRSALVGDSNIVFPTNSAKQIVAVSHRGYNSDIIDSKFNLVDDELKGLSYDNNLAITLEQKFAEIQAVLLSGFALVGDIGSGTSGNITVGGEITSASKTNVGGGDTHSIITFFFDDVGTTDYAIILNIESLGTDESDNDLKQWVYSNKTSASFIINIEETSGTIQNLRFHATLIQN